MNKRYLIILGFLVLFQPSFSQEFKEIPGSQIPGLYLASFDYSDIDADGDLDVVLMGFDGSQVATSQIYKNNGCGIFTLDASNSLLGLGDGTAKFADFDHDGDDDLLLTGRTNMNGIPDSKTIIYQNTGNHSGNFVSTTADLANVGGIAEVADFDGNNYPDVLLCYNTTKLFLNSGSWSFTEKSGNPFSYYYASAASGDIDGDNDIDLFLTKNGQAKIYTNDGNANFTEKAGNNIQWVYSSTADFFDSDNDGDLDLFVTGVNTDNGYTQTANLYRNNGNGIFSQISLPNVVGFQVAGVGIADFNEDGKEDIFVSGSTNSSPTYQANFYLNQGSNSFQLAFSNQITPLTSGANSVFDVDSDGDLDLVISGYSGSYSAKVYKNDIVTGVDEVNTCGPFTWINGITYSSSTTASYTIPNATQNGCDSTVMLNLTIRIPESVQNVTACQSYTWIDGNTYTEKTSASYTIVGGSYMGCDSIVHLELTVESPSPTTDYVITDQSTYTWINGFTYAAGGNNIATYTPANPQGCSNPVSLNLTLNVNGVNQEEEAEFRWVKRVIEPTQDPYCISPRRLSSTLLSNGDLMVLGPAKCNVQLLTTSGQITIPAGGGFLARYTKNGELIWAQAVTGVAESPGIMSSDEQDNIYFFGGSGIRKFSSEGNFLLDIPIAGDKTLKALVIRNNVIYLAGDYRNYNNSPTPFGLPLPFIRDGFFAKLNATNGNLIAAKSLVGNYENFIQGLALDNQGNIFLTGDFIFNCDFDPSAAEHILYGPSGGYFPENDASGTVFLAKYDANMNFIWAKAFRSSGSDVQRPTGIRVDQSNNQIYLAGYFRNTMDLDPSNATHTITANVKRNYFIAKYNSNGGFIWGKGYGGNYNDEPTAIDLDANGNLLLAGNTNIRTVTHPENSNWELVKADIEIHKYLSNGTLAWIKSFSSDYGTYLDEDQNSLRSIHSTENGGFIAAGTFTRSMDFDDGPGYAVKTANTSNNNTYWGQDLFFMGYGNIPPCSENLVLASPIDDISTQGIELEANSTTGQITASNKIQNGASATYRAGKYIKLDPGFTAQSGAIFKTEFGGCN
mgnify:CR=1 FL=1